jgi:lysophospholipase L1-like esterase
LKQVRGENGHVLRRSLVALTASAALVAGPLAAAEEPPLLRSPVYAALGDSYSAGEGVAPYEAGTDDVTNKCHRSEAAWPKLLATREPVEGRVLRFVACGGARTGHVLSEEQYPGDQTGGQVSALRALEGHSSADVVTVTIGGNDARFGEIVRACVLGVLPCSWTYSDEQQWIEEVVRPALAKTFEALREAAPRARIFAVTYPQIFQTGDECRRDMLISPREKRWIRERTAQLNSVIVEEAEGAGLIPVDVGDAFAGHEICTAEPWAWGVLEGDGAFHPTGEGHEVLAEWVARAVGRTDEVPTVSDRVEASL